MSSVGPFLPHGCLSAASSLLQGGLQFRVSLSVYVTTVPGILGAQLLKALWLSLDIPFAGAEGRSGVRIGVMERLAQKR